MNTEFFFDHRSPLRPLLAGHTSFVEPFPHQITAVYGEIIPRRPFSFLLAGDLGAGKTIMAELLIKALFAWGMSSDVS